MVIGARKMDMRKERSLRVIFERLGGDVGEVVNWRKEEKRGSDAS